MKGKILASRYAKAVFELALEKKLLNDINNDMKLIDSVTGESKELMTLLRNPVLKPKKKKAILKAIFENKIQAVTLKFLFILTDNGRESYIRDVTEEFQELYNEYNNIITASLTTAVKIDSDVMKKIVSLIEKQTKATIKLQENINENIIGGFVLDYDDYEYDASIRHQIKKLKKEFDSNLYVKGF
jgi:F-type H+-transporting ATPase subunit delta